MVAKAGYRREFVLEYIIHSAIEMLNRHKNTTQSEGNFIAVMFFAPVTS
jgi:hypothetical protein